MSPKATQHVEEKNTVDIADQVAAIPRHPPLSHGNITHHPNSTRTTHHQLLSHPATDGVSNHSPTLVPPHLKNGAHHLAKEVMKGAKKSASKCTCISIFT